MSTRSTSIFKDPNVAKHLSLLHDNFFFIVSADKVHNNIVSVCKSHYIDCLIKELGIDNLLGNPTYTPTKLTKEEILENHRSVSCSFGISTKDEELDLPSFYQIPNLHKCPFKQRYTAGSAKCSTKPLSKLLTCILSAVKTGLQSYCDTSYSRCGVNQMWILKNAKDLFDYIQSRSLSSYNSIKTRGSQEPVIAHLVFNLTSKVDRKWGLHIILKVDHPKIILTQISKQKILM